ncbi:MAG: rhomboid family intramembrane serine protease [bacterium]
MTFENTLLAATMVLGTSAGMAMVGRYGAHRIPFLTLAVAVLTSAGFVTQLLESGALEALQRNGSAIAAGQWWRLLTALLVQDGGWAGFVSNLAGLVLIGASAEQLISRRAWTALYLVPAFIVELIALRWQPVGGGNSVAWMALAGAMWILALRHKGGPGLSLLGWAGLAIGALLSMKSNIHGPAILLGAALAWGMAARFPGAIPTHEAKRG